MELGKWLSTNGVSINKFAERMGVHRTTVSRWINGHSIPNLAMRKRIAEYTGLKLKVREYGFCRMCRCP